LYFAFTTDKLSSAQNHNIGSFPTTGPKCRAPSDLEIEAALSSLEASTAAIEKQCRALEVQKSFLKKLATDDRTTPLDSDDSPRAQQQKKFAKDQAQASLEADELSQALNSKLQSVSKQVETASGRASSHVERILEKDDRLLGGLQKLVPRLASTAEPDDAVEEVENLCSTLATFTVREIHARLDAAYKSTIAKYSGLSNGSLEGSLSEQQLKQRDTLQAELDELGGEIEGLVTIAIDNHYRKPLRQSMLAAHAENQNQKSQWGEYTVMSLQYLAARLEILDEHIQQVQGHSAALQTLTDALREITKSARRDTESAGGGANGNGNGMDKATAKGLKPLRLVQANLSESSDPTFQLLRQLDVRVMDMTSASTITEILSPALDERREKLALLSRTTEESLSEIITRSIAKGDGHVHDLLKAVYAPTKYRSVKLVDEEIDAAMDRLEEQTQVTGDEMRVLDFEGIVGDVKGRQEVLIGRLS
jgi:uncharacterized protein YoxC